MSNKYTLPLKDVVNIHLNVSARAAARNAFNLCLLMGDIGSNVDLETPGSGPIPGRTKCSRTASP